MPGLIPNTKELEKKIGDIGEKVEEMADRMVAAQEAALEQQKLMVMLLMSIKEKLVEDDITLHPDTIAALTSSKIAVTVPTSTNPHWDRELIDSLEQVYESSSSGILPEA